MTNLSRSGKQTLAMLAVDNIHLSKEGLELFVAVDSGEMSMDDAKESVRARARRYGAKSAVGAFRKRNVR